MTDLTNKPKFSQRGEQTLHEKLFNEFFSHTIGLDALFNQLSTFKQVNSNFPPYNIVRKDNKTFVEIALAGYSKDTIDVVVEDGVLSITGKANGDNEHIHKDSSHVQKWNVVYRGIASRSFERSFKLGEYVEVNSATMKDGMLTVELEEVLPPEKQPKIIDIK